MHCGRRKSPGFDERRFNELYAKHLAPDRATIVAFAHSAQHQPELALRVLTKVRADAATSPAAVLAMFALAISGLSFMVNLLLTLTKANDTGFGGVWFWPGEALCILVLALVGVWLFILQSRKHRSAETWKAALEDSVR